MFYITFLNENNKNRENKHKEREVWYKATNIKYMHFINVYCHK